MTWVLAVPAPAGPPSGPPPDEQAAARLLAIAGGGFRIRETDHFTIAYDTPYDVVRPLIGRLEATFDAVWSFCEAAGLILEDPRARFQVVLFDGLEDYRQYRAKLGLPPDAAATGFYWPETNVAAFVNTLSRPEVVHITEQIEQTLAELKEISANASGGESARTRRRALRRHATILRTSRNAIVEKFNRFVIQHEAAHQLFFNLGLHVRGAENPRWFVEGLACQFEVPQTGPSGGVKRISHMRLADLRDALAVEASTKTCTDTQYQGALDSKRLLQIADIIGQAEAFSGRDSNVTFRYAQAWGLVYYLHREHPEAFLTYLRRLSSRRPGRPSDRTQEIGDFVSAFGPIDRRLEHAWINYMLRLRYKPREAGR
jgi:hypothetical protein